MTTTRPDPFTLPEWQALHREASLVSQLIGAGATALGRASYGDGLGEYYTAFFGLSIGIERLAKLILIADYAIGNGGSLPGQAVVRKFGHDLKMLVAAANQVEANHSLKLGYPKPSDRICWAALDCLDAFADASKGRYANFEAIGNPAFDTGDEPVRKWWTNVVEPILSSHYRSREAEETVKLQAATIGTLIGDSALARFTSETGSMMTDVATASERSGQTKFAQRYGRFYTLAVVRWLSDIFTELSHKAVSQQGVDALFGHHKFFGGYRVEDNFLRERKVWPLK